MNHYSEEESMEFTPKMIRVLDLKKRRRAILEYLDKLTLLQEQAERTLDKGEAYCGWYDQYNAQRKTIENIQDQISGLITDVNSDLQKVEMRLENLEDGE